MRSKWDPPRKEMQLTAARLSPRGRLSQLESHFSVFEVPDLSRRRRVSGLQFGRRKAVSLNQGSAKKKKQPTNPKNKAAANDGTIR